MTLITLEAEDYAPTPEDFTATPRRDYDAIQRDRAIDAAAELLDAELKAPVWEVLVTQGGRLVALVRHNLAVLRPGDEVGLPIEVIAFAPAVRYLDDPESESGTPPTASEPDRGEDKGGATDEQ